MGEWGSSGSSLTRLSINWARIRLTERRAQNSSLPGATRGWRVAGQVSLQVGPLIAALSPTAATSPDARAGGAFPHPERESRRNLRA